MGRRDRHGPDWSLDGDGHLLVERVVWVAVIVGRVIPAVQRSPRSGRRIAEWEGGGGR